MKGRSGSKSAGDIGNENGRQKGPQAREVVGGLRGREEEEEPDSNLLDGEEEEEEKGCVIISGGRMTKGLT